MPLEQLLLSPEVSSGKSHPLPFHTLLVPSSPADSLPSQENTLASLLPPKAPSTQTPPSRRQCDQHHRQCPQEAEHGVYDQAGEVEGGDADGGGDETEG